MSTKIKLNHDETIITFDNGLLFFHPGFYDPDISKYFEVNLSSMTGTMEIVFKEVAIARINQEKSVLLRGIYAPDVFNALKVFKNGIYLNEPCVVVGLKDTGITKTNYFLCKQSQDCDSWESEFENEAVTLFSLQDAEIELQRQKEADMDWFTTLSVQPISYFAN
jgi:hypothetical protein